MGFLKPYGACPNEIQMEHYHMEKKAFFHFGVNTFTNMEWGEGTESEKEFNPVGCDCRQWMRSIKAAGFKLAIITAKHHDGFCLWQSEYTEHCMKNSPYKDGKGDIIREFTDACHEFGIKAGIYISPWDRNAPFWGTSEYSPFFAKQMTELLTNYGRIDEVWWDGAGSNDTPYDWGMWAYTVKSLQPHAAIYGSRGATPYADLRWVGNEAGFAGNPCFATINAATLESEKIPPLNVGDEDGDLFVIAEVDTSTRPGWFFHEDQENEVKTVAQLVHLWFDSVGSNCNMLLNFPPDRTGHLRDKDVHNAIEAHHIISKARSVNFISTATVTADQEYYEGYQPENIKIPGEEVFFAPKSKEVTLEIKLSKKERFNMFEIGEMIRYGHRIRGFRIQALEGRWKTLYEGRCIGYKWADYFETVETDTLRIVVYDSKDVPLLNFFGLYYLDTSVFAEEERLKTGVDLAKGKSAKLTVTEHEAELEFGGIYPFNTIKFNGTGLWEYSFEAFDGLNYHTIYKGTTPHREQIVTLPETVKTSYKIKFCSSRVINPDTLNLEVYHL